MAPARPIGRKSRRVEQMTHQKLRVPPCPRRASGHASRLARERSTRECEADESQACGLVRMTSYRTGQVVGYGRSAGGVRTEPRPQRQEDELPPGEQVDPGVNALPSVALTTKFLALCQQYGAERLAVRIVASQAGAPACPGCRTTTTGRRGTPTRCARRSGTCSASAAPDRAPGGSVTGDVEAARDSRASKSGSSKPRCFPGKGCEETRPRSWPAARCGWDLGR